MPARLCPYCKVVSNFSRGGSTNAAETPTHDISRQLGLNHQELSLDDCQNCRATTYFRAMKGSGNEVFDQYPKVIEEAPAELPDQVRRAFHEALVCYGAEAPNGSLLMCRRALQETMNDLKAVKGDLPKQLEYLVEERVITPQLREWADQSRIGGKIAAHGTGGDEWGDPDKIWGNMDDAEIVIGYLKGFFDYVYVFEEQMKQRMKKHKLPASQSETDSNED